MTSRRIAARHGARRRAFTLAAVVAVCISAAPARAQERSVIEPGHEAEIQALFAPRRLGEPVSEGFVFYSLEIRSQEIVVGVRKGGVDHLAHLRHAGSGGEPLGSFAVTVETDDPTARQALRDLLAPLATADGSAVWTRVRPPPVPSASTSERPESGTTFWILHALMVLSALFGLVSWSGRDRRRLTRATLTLGTAALWAAGFFALSSPALIPLRAISGLQEGLTKMVLELLAGRGAHVGPNFDALRELWIHTPSPLRTRVWIDAGLTGVDLLLLFGIARELAGSYRAALLVTLAFALAPTTLLMATSESPAAWLTLYLFALLAVVAGLSAARRPWHRRALGLSLLPATVILGRSRVEWWAVGVLALLAAALSEPALERRLMPPLRRLGRSLAAAGRRPLPWLALVSLCLLYPRALRALPLPAAAEPWLDELLGSPIVVALWLLRAAGVGAGLLILAGMLYGCLHWRRSLLTPAALFVMLVAYAQMGHSGDAEQEMWRYLTLAMPAAYLLLPLGWRGLVAFADRRGWPAGWRTPALGLAVLATAAALPAGQHRWPLVGVEPEELRALLQTLDRHPGCALMTPVTEAEAQGASTNLGGLRWAVFGHGRPPRELPMDGRDPRELLRSAAPDARCHLLYHSATCSLEGAPGCPRLGAPEERVEERAVPNTPYYVHVHYRDPVVLYLVPADAPARSARRSPPARSLHIPGALSPRPRPPRPHPPRPDHRAPGDPTHAVGTGRQRMPWTAARQAPWRTRVWPPSGASRPHPRGRVADALRAAAG